MYNFIKFHKFKLLTFSLVLVTFLFSIYLYNSDNRNLISKYNKYTTASDIVRDVNNVDLSIPKFTRNTNMIDYSNIEFSTWDIETASLDIEKNKIKPYTIMIYMNGSDLESEHGAATDDLIEMLDSGLKSENANLIIFTGGANRWQNDVVPANECVIWEVKDGQIYEIAGVGLVNMGNAGTLSSFIDFSVENYPAEKYGLILWDHGGGSIAGYGHDEKFNNDNLSLLDMNYAFEKSAIADTKLEFLGFDSCLMASVEMAIIASDYAKYLIASEDLTPGDGWDYNFLSVLNYNPYIDGLTLGMAITDFFMDYYGFFSNEDLNMSVIDLVNVNNVMYSMGKLMQRATDNLTEDDISSFRNLARRRSGTRTFGIGSPRDNESDMVDIGDMAYRLSDLYPEEVDELFRDLNKAVVYNRNNSNTLLSGLSTFYIYGGRDSANESLYTYTTLGMDEGYTGFLHKFSDILLDNNIFRQNLINRSNLNTGNENLVRSDLTIWQPLNKSSKNFIMTGIKNDLDINSDKEIESAINGLWAALDGRNVCMYKISDSNGHSLYSIPAELNGKDCDIVVLICDDYPEGKILGVRYEDGFIIQKGYNEIEDGDIVSLYYPKRNFDSNSSEENDNWYKSESFEVNGELKLEWLKLQSQENYYSFRLICIQNKEHFNGLKPIE